MATSSVLAGEVCTGDECVNSVGLMQKDARTYPLQAPGPAAPGVPTYAPDPEAVQTLYGWASDHSDESKTEMNKAEFMGETEDTAALAASRARNKAAEAGEASVAFAASSGEHKEASDLATEASAARARSIAADQDAASAKQKYDKMSAIEARAMEAASAKAKEVKKAQVLKNTKAMQVKQLKASLSETETRCAGDKEAKKAADDNVDMSKRELGTAEDFLQKKNTSAQEAHDTWVLADKAKDKANTESSTAMSIQANKAIELGLEQAERAKIDIEESLSERDRQAAREKFDAAQAAAHSALQTATEEEASASAAVTVANGMISRAKALADVVPIQAWQDHRAQYKGAPAAPYVAPSPSGPPPSPPGPQTAGYAPPEPA